MAVGKKQFLSLDVRVFADLYHLSDGGSSNRWRAGCVESFSIVYSSAEVVGTSNVGGQGSADDFQ